ncbi:MAG: DUF4854 domain-containing protein [Clostridiales bacterium]|nr:DUF4854 domain-containing protein [Clostridiales bacterium]
MKKRVPFTLLTLLAALALLLSACGMFDQSSAEPVTLEEYAAGDPEIQEAIDSALTDSSVRIEISGNDIIYTFDLSIIEGYTEDVAKDEAIISALESTLDGAGATYGGLAKNIESRTGIEGVRTIVNYSWEDEILVTHTYTSADAAS